MADARKLTNWIWGLASALLLFVIVAHAVAPVEPDRLSSRGSAFSASTEEVSLKSGEGALVARDGDRIEPPVPIPQVPALAASIAAQPAEAVLQSFAAVVPRLASVVLGPISVRAPPLA